MQPWLLVLGMLAGSAPTPAQHAPAASLEAASADAKRFQLSADFTLSTWAAEPQLLNPVAFSLAPLPGSSPTNLPGIAAFVAETHRYGSSVLDITQNTSWLLNDLSFRSPWDRLEFLTREFGTNAPVLVRDSEMLRRVADADGDGQAEQTGVFADGFNSVADGAAAGVLVRGDRVWFANIPNLWSFPASAASGSVAGPIHAGTNTVTRLAEHSVAGGFGAHIGVTGHDLHGLVTGPDGRIYASFGDRGAAVTARDGRSIFLPDSGGVLRCEPDGSKLELFCSGLRNPQELAFDDHGNLFTVDNDTAGADDCRVLHLVEGADYGWRASYQHMKGFGPWVQEGLWAGGWDGQLPPAGKVSQGPSGLTRYPGTGFGDRFQGRFLHADFPGGIWSFGLEPHGTTYAVGPKEKILWNGWFTDVEFGPDGALYVLDWVNGWTVPKKGRIHRLVLDSPSPNDVALSREVHAWLAEGPRKRSDRDLLAALGHPDRRIRLEAQFELARRGPTLFRDLRGIALSERNTVARLHALWAIGQIARTFSPGQPGGDFSEELASLLRLLDDSDETVAGHAARLLAEQALLHVDLPAAALTTDASPRLRFAGAMALGDLMVDGHRAAPTLPQKATSWLEANLPAIGRAVSRHVDTSFAFHPGRAATDAMVRTNLHGDPFLRHAAARHWERLERLEATWPSYSKGRHPGVSAGLLAALRNPSPDLRHAALLAARRTTNAAIAVALRDSNPFLTVEAARAIHDLPIPGALPELADCLLPSSPDSAPVWAALPDVSLAAWRASRTNDSAPPFEATWQSPIPLPAQTTTLRRQFLNRALDANFRLGKASHAEALAEFALPASDAPRAMTTEVGARIEALFLLARWEVLPAAPGHVPAKIVPDPNHGAVPTVNPENWSGWFDRVVGLWRPLPPRPPDLARTAMASRVNRLLADPDAGILAAGIDALARLGVREAIEPLAEFFGRATTPASVRRTLPSALASLHAPPALLASVVRRAVDDPDAGVRTAAIPLIAESLRGPDAVPILARLIDAGLAAPREPAGAQAALVALGHVEGPAAAALLEPLVRRWADGSLPREFELEVREAADLSSVPAIRELATRAREHRGRSSDLVGAEWADVHFGGDPARGRTVFFEKTEVQCSRCHRVGTEGGTVGPALDKVAQGRDRAYLLEAVLQPNARIAPGFENVTLVLSDGRDVSGLLESEDAAMLVVDTGEDGEVRVPKSAVVRRQRGLSAMPEGLAQLLSRRELRDLVAYLVTLGP